MRPLVGALALILTAAGPVMALQSPGAEQTAERSPVAVRASQDPVLEARASALASELRCPVCQGVSIEASPSPLALQMKDLIRTQLAEGRTDQEVRAYFVSRYGEWVLLEPRASGFNLLVYVLPALGLLAGAGLLVVVVRRWSGPPAAAEGAPGAGAPPA